MAKGEPLESLLLFVHPLDRERRIRDLRCSLVDRTRKTSQFRVDDRRCETVWITEEVDPIWTGGRYRGLVGVGLPAAERHQSSLASPPFRPGSGAVGEPRTLEGAGVLTHEVRNCLTGVLGAMELLRESPTCERQTQLLEAAEDRCHSLLRMLDQSLQVFRYEAKDNDSKCCVFDPTRNAKKVLVLLEKMAQARGLDLRLHLEPGLPRMVRGDPALLNQILVNLLSNALKYTEKGSVCLSLAPCREGLRFEVRDTGPGMSPDFQMTMFDPYERVDKVEDGQTGVGLGLHICRRLVDLLNGKLRCQTQVNEGTAFHLTVPFLEADAPRDVCAKDKTKTGYKTVEGLNLLVVDDQTVVRQVLKHQLQKIGHQVTTAPDGYAALHHLDQSPVDLILMDLHLPRMDGLETTRRVREKFGVRPYIVGLTGEAQKGARQRCLEAGMDDCLFKPLSMNQLSQYLSSLDWKGSEIELSNG